MLGQRLTDGVELLALVVVRPIETLRRRAKERQEDLQRRLQHGRLALLPELVDGGAVGVGCAEFGGELPQLVRQQPVPAHAPLNPAA